MQFLVLVEEAAGGNRSANLCCFSWLPAWSGSSGGEDIATSRMHFPRIPPPAFFVRAVSSVLRHLSGNAIPLGAADLAGILPITICRPYTATSAKAAGDIPKAGENDFLAIANSLKKSMKYLGPWTAGDLSFGLCEWTCLCQFVRNARSNLRCLSNAGAL